MSEQIPFSKHIHLIRTAFYWWTQSCEMLHHLNHMTIKDDSYFSFIFGVLRLLDKYSYVKSFPVRGKFVLTKDFRLPSKSLTIK